MPPPPKKPYPQARGLKAGLSMHMNALVHLQAPKEPHDMRYKQQLFPPANPAPRPNPLVRSGVAEGASRRRLCRSKASGPVRRVLQPFSGKLSLP